MGVATASSLAAVDAPVAQLDRALPSEGKGQRFESPRARQFLFPSLVSFRASPARAPERPPASLRLPVAPFCAHCRGSPTGRVDVGSAARLHSGLDLGRAA